MQRRREGSLRIQEQRVTTTGWTDSRAHHLVRYSAIRTARHGAEGKTSHIGDTYLQLLKDDERKKVKITRSQMNLNQSHSCAVVSLSMVLTLLTLGACIYLQQGGPRQEFNQEARRETSASRSRRLVQ